MTQFHWIVIIGVLCIAFYIWSTWYYSSQSAAKKNNLSIFLFCNLFIADPPSNSLSNNFRTLLGSLKASKKSDKIVAIFTGVLGVNENQLIFSGHRNKDEAEEIIRDVSEISRIELSDYDESEIYSYMLSKFGNMDDVKYCKFTAFESSRSKKMPRFMKNSKLCKITFTDNLEMRFYYKNTEKNAAAFEHISKCTCEN